MEDQPLYGRMYANVHNRRPSPVVWRGNRVYYEES
jgi:hypothetical protein